MSEFWLCFNCCIAEQPQPRGTLQYYLTHWIVDSLLRPGICASPLPFTSPTILKVSNQMLLGLPTEHSLNLYTSVYAADSRIQKRRRRIDRSMIGEPTNFVHTAHVGSGDLFSGMNSVSSIQNQMQSKGGYGGGMAANVQMQLVDTKAG
ncbi:CDC42 small effector protein 2 isoform X1 [Camelus ferus]|uniref:CDC42 small effector protein 2 n=10 Tax=Camelus TaxID=9836 RepID=A0A8B8SRL7_CAMFR|nr:CDC42 small effector protein 2 isoform X1 [Camelus ferus]XP_032332546.1 CDC42 small effector protein 2 isoform X1 [Camelus ferus]XP_032332547.1 CDC42 small effector protein 2 isoform X1 [Camelus ferus]XP_032332548.1 CDC42 small effector protein 2 isoform X1 [Camelus ferus]XP_032332549.1 CDC42 small effector protein 2 isoform X1 [Camelus ferus]XP_032332550.1 CDC42 small effector protein 2 isoform X1 [Camelus ferus]XP_045363720.1 CDC42 small effector protein 2 isoform X1 [Camelus bactrianus]